MIDFQKDNPYAAPVSVDNHTFDGNINEGALRYLRSASRWAVFVVIMSILFIPLFVIAMFSQPFYIFAVLVMGLVTWFSLQYIRSARNVQTARNNEQLLPCLSSSTALLKVHAICLIIFLVLTIILILSQWLSYTSGPVSQ